MKEKIKNNYKILVAFILGGLIIGGLGTAYAVSIASSSVSYDNTTSGATATDVKGAIDELYSLANNPRCPTGYTKSGTDDTYTCMNNKIKYGVYPSANQLILNSAVPVNAILHNTPNDALADWTNASVMNKASQRPFYLKHKIENDVVTESYVVFVVTPEMAAENSGMVAGTYELRGEKTYENDAYIVDENYISPYYEANKEAIKTAFGYSTNPSRCIDSGTGRSSIFYCSVSGFYAGANASGYVDAEFDSSSGCYVSNVGISYCS